MTPTNPTVGKFNSPDGGDVRSISVSELRRRLTAILDEVEKGERL